MFDEVQKFKEKAKNVHEAEFWAVFLLDEAPKAWLRSQRRSHNADAGFVRRHDAGATMSWLRNRLRQYRWFWVR